MKSEIGKSRATEIPAGEGGGKRADITGLAIVDYTPTSVKSGTPRRPMNTQTPVRKNGHEQATQNTRHSKKLELARKAPLEE